MTTQKHSQFSRYHTGALKSSLSIELHSDYAIRLWTGRPADKSVQGGIPAIPGMPQAIHVAGLVYHDSAEDNPYADMVMVQLEQALVEASVQTQQNVDKLDALLTTIPAHIVMGGIAAANPLNIGVFCHSPLGYRCVWLLVGYDSLVMKAIQAHHYGLIPRLHRDTLLKRGAHQVRSIYGILRRWRRMAVTRADILHQTAQGIAAVSRLGPPDADIMSGTVRSSFSPPLRQESPSAVLPPSGKIRGTSP